MDAEWILCPLCGGKTRDKIREDTVLVNYPLYCPKEGVKFSVSMGKILL